MNKTWRKHSVIFFVEIKKVQPLRPVNEASTTSVWGGFSSLQKTVYPRQNRKQFFYMILVKKISWNRYCLNLRNRNSTFWLISKKFYFMFLREKLRRPQNIKLSKWVKSVDKKWKSKWISSFQKLVVRNHFKFSKFMFKAQYLEAPQKYEFRNASVIM